MRTVGIIAEYNPFHYGHAYQLKQVRQITKADCLVILMSGNVVQRGEFAIIDKWQRAELALLNGADLVIELPLTASLQSADFFADEAIEVLSRLEIDSLAFGTETAELDELNQYLDWLEDKDLIIQQQMAVEMQKGVSYAFAHQKVVKQVAQETNFVSNFDFSSANHLLGLQYMRAIRKRQLNVNIHPLPRVNEVQKLNQLLKLPQEMLPTQILSGSQIRQNYWENRIEAKDIPMTTYQKLSEKATTRWDHYYGLLNYAIMALGPSGLKEIHGLVEGFEQAIFKQNLQTQTFETLTQQLISPRWTRSAINRMLMNILLHISDQDWRRNQLLNQELNYLRILAFNSNGREFLKAFNSNRLYLFSNLSKDMEEHYQLMLKADRIFQGNPQSHIKEQIIGKHPVHRQYGII
ncbi:nucleotidyltransferase family protein [Facklamia sp. DSM 111018]|uniref:tRNA(Met) cytidine acetate ligase n=1 Tax=Facklamia lactis TaxID=2749967 RepID=A0ABS0LTU5_9LACT|nr:nucleotidyltransferase family protein [Facklamia lactis]MBG9980918.1 nucleotidyltransferase family protein [Facklamia lactis]MBG9986719.1 nucleotidyltransferase family protein [Facklamia lactis]